MKRRIRQVLACLIMFSLVLGITLTSVQQSEGAQAKPVLTMEQARALALKNSSKVERLENKLEMQKIKKAQAEKSLAMREKSMKTFRWSPLLSFKFPTDPNLSEIVEFDFKPLSIQAEIDTVQHQLTDVKFEIYEQVNTVYLDIVMLEKKIALLEEQIDVLDKAISKNQIRLLQGLAKQEDIDAMVAKRKSHASKLLSHKRNLTNRKKKLAELTANEQVRTDYRFENPFVEADLKRTTDLPNLLQYTLDNDQTYYEACMTEVTAKLEMMTNYEAMSKKFGNNAMSLISKYYMMALNGEKINSREFKANYKTFLNKIDEQWNGSYRILFIRIPKLWFKGDTDGSRYVEDEPYAFYDCALAYQDARLERLAVEADITSQVEDSFENYVSIKNAYAEIVSQVEDAKKQLEKERLLNRLGTMTYDEYESSLENFETLQNDMMDTMQTYSASMYEFDRLTCGAIGLLLTEGGLNPVAAEMGDSVLTEDEKKGSYYYITQIIQNEEFCLNISLAEDLEGEITHYELWCDETQLGDRTEVDQVIRHLALALKSIEKVTIRLYNEGEFVDECEIDPRSTSGELEITVGYQVTHAQDHAIGSYEVEVNDTTGMLEIKILPNNEEGIAYYLIRSDAVGSYLYSNEHISVQSPFKYLSVIQNELETLTIEFYDENKNMLYTGKFSTSGLKITKNAEQ